MYCSLMLTKKGGITQCSSTLFAMVEEKRLEDGEDNLKVNVQSRIEEKKGA